jgi:hypothetical protein
MRYKNQELIKSSNFEGIKDQTGKKSVSSSYLGALDLWASSYSDATPSAKTNAMRVGHTIVTCFHYKHKGMLQGTQVRVAPVTFTCPSKNTLPGQR